MDKHTPSPWKVLKQNNNFFNIYAGEYADEGEPDLLAEVTTFNEGDARLIAAAPELLRACTSALSFVEELENHGITNWTGEEELRKAIAKATQTEK